MLGRLIYFEVHVMRLLQLLILQSFSKSLSYSVVLFFVDKLNVALGKNLKKNLMDSCKLLYARYDNLLSFAIVSIFK